MSRSALPSRHLRWAVPVCVIAVAGVVTASLVSAAQGPPELPQRTAAQLLAAVAGQPGPPPPLTGTVVETASLGLPALPSMGDPTSPQALLTGSHTVRVWYADPQHFRLAIPGQLSETDVIRNGSNMWTWSSVHNTATHTVMPARAGIRVPVPLPDRARLTPQDAARKVLAAVGPTTKISVASNVMVAGQPCYELVLAPKDSRSLVGQVRIAVDAHHNVPLRVQVFARGDAAAPAFQTGFTSIAFTRPATANFAFTPPPGSKVVQQNQSPGTVVFGAQRRIGVPKMVLPPPGVRARVAKLPGVVISVPRGAELPRFVRVPRGARVVEGAPVPPGMMPFPAKARLMHLPSDAVPLPYLAPNEMPFPGVPGRVLPTTAVGKGWLTVAVLPAGGPDVFGGNSVTGLELRALLRSASHVRGSWGSGSLLRTKLVSVLITDDGRLFIGAVTPGVLYNAAQKVHVTQRRQVAQGTRLPRQSGR